MIASYLFWWWNMLKIKIRLCKYENEMGLKQFCSLKKSFYLLEDNNDN